VPWTLNQVQGDVVLSISEHSPDLTTSLASDTIFLAVEFFRKLIRERERPTDTDSFERCYCLPERSGARIGEKAEGRAEGGTS